MNSTYAKLPPKQVWKSRSRRSEEGENVREGVRKIEMHAAHLVLGFLYVLRVLVLHYRDYWGCVHAQSCLTLCDPTDCTPLGSSVHGFPQARILEWVAISSSRGSSQCRKCRFDPWVGKIPWRRKWRPTSVFMPGKSHRHSSLVGYSLWGHKEILLSTHTNGGMCI